MTLRSSAFPVLAVERLADGIHGLEQGDIDIGGPGHAGQGKHRMVEDLMVLPGDAFDEVDGIASLR